MVIAKLRARLFPAPDDPDSVPTWLSRLSAEVRDEIDARMKGQGDPRASLAAELGQVDEQVLGWSISLGNPNLPTSTRAALEGLLEPALERRRQVERRLAELEAARSQIDAILDEGAVLDRLRHLEVVLADGNVAEGNRELRRVVDRVACYADGRVVLRTFRQGLFEGATAWLNPAPKANPAVQDGLRYWIDPVDFVKPPPLRLSIVGRRPCGRGPGQASGDRLERPATVRSFRQMPGNHRQGPGVGRSRWFAADGGLKVEGPGGRPLFRSTPDPARRDRASIFLRPSTLHGDAWPAPGETSPAHRIDRPIIAQVLIGSRFAMIASAGASVALRAARFDEGPRSHPSRPCSALSSRSW